MWEAVVLSRHSNIGIGFDIMIMSVMVKGCATSTFWQETMGLGNGGPDDQVWEAGPSECV